jgi:hypothetical protein
MQSQDAPHSKADIEHFRKEIGIHGWTTFNSAYLTNLCGEARREYLVQRRQGEVHPPDQGFSRSDLKTGPWRKLAIGSTNGLGEPYAQLLQTTYFLEDDRAFPALSELFATLLKLRNMILDIDVGFGSHPERDKFWNACRIHHYPVGGGFMTEHRDTYFPSALAKSKLPFLQVMALLSTKGADFEEGGGFVRNHQGERVCFEDKSGIGTVVMFDGGVHHGVLDVNRSELLDLESNRGRIAAFVNVYEVR